MRCERRSKQALHRRKLLDSLAYLKQMFGGLWLLKSPRSILTETTDWLLIAEIGKLKRHATVPVQGFDLRPVNPGVALTQLRDLLGVALGVSAPIGPTVTIQFGSSDLFNSRSVNTMGHPFGGWTYRTNSSNTTRAGLMGTAVCLASRQASRDERGDSRFFYRGILAMT